MGGNSTLEEFGVGTLATGQGLLYLFPNATGNVAVWHSYLRDSADISAAYRDAATRAGMSIDERFTRGPLLEIDQLGFSSHYTSNLGNSATMAELDLLRSQYGASIWYSS